MSRFGKKKMIYISKRGFICAFCNRKRKGAYTFSDGERSCEKCNRGYDYKPKITGLYINCPVCKQEWHIGNKQ